MIGRGGHLSSILFIRPIFLKIGYSCRKGQMDNQGNNRSNVFWSRLFIERMTNDTPKYFIAVVRDNLARWMRRKRT